MRIQMRIHTPEEVHDKQKAPVKAYDKQKTSEEVYGEKEALAEANIEQETPEKVIDKKAAPEEAQIPENYEISMSYMHKGCKWDRNDIVINTIFEFQVGLEIIRNDEDPEPKNVEEC